MTAVAREIAERRASHIANPLHQLAFLIAYAAARTAALNDRDTELPWRRMLADPETPPASLAGWIEGLASTRTRKEQP
ncbi:hypothetical protein [Streptomyces xiamenensis]|uniref:hypothetical protein n=1 Tax=Streptomyces xiamenensis TaxID=408015 RepID=UPI003D71E2CA